MSNETQDAQREVWLVKPANTIKAKAVKHKITEAPKSGPRHEQTLGAIGEYVEVYTKGIDLGPLWDCTDKAVLVSLAAQALLLDAGERYKGAFLKGETGPNDPAFMAQCVADSLSEPAHMRDISPSQAKAPAPSGKIKAKTSYADTMASYAAQIKAAKEAGDKKLAAELTMAMLDVELPS